MAFDFERRAFLGAAGAFVAFPVRGQNSGHGVREVQPRTYDDRLIPNFSFEVIELSLQGGLGVYALDTHTGRASGWAEHIRAPVNSTFKFLLAGAILRRVDTGLESLERQLPVRSSDLVSWSPILEHAVGQSLPIRALCAAAMTQSDNTAANLLLQSLGGPAGLTQALRDAGDMTTRIDRFEPDLNATASADERDTTTPAQMVRNMEAFLRGKLLSQESKSILLSWMIENTTGQDRLRAGVPPGWTVGDRTGTGRQGETSTIAAIYPPERAPLLMAVYMQGSRLAVAEQSAHHAELARIATKNLLLPPYDPYPDD